jgi:hypothetical protein
MIRTLLAIVTTILVPSSPAFADDATVPAVYDTVDAVEVYGGFIVVTGIISGQGGPTTLRYGVFDQSSTAGTGAARCDRLALLAMSKPGKFQFATVRVVSGIAGFSCKLIIRTP